MPSLCGLCTPSRAFPDFGEQQSEFRPIRNLCFFPCTGRGLGPALSCGKTDIAARLTCLPPSPTSLPHTASHTGAWPHPHARATN